MDLGAGRRGVDMGPSAIRIAGAAEKIRDLGYHVIDEGDIHVKPPEQQDVFDQKLKYLPAIAKASATLARKVEGALNKGHLPLVLGGDHAIAIGTMAGIGSFCRKRKKTFGVLWIDAHGDINTKETTPSGNIHGMSLAVSIGLGDKRLVSIGGNFPKVDPRHVVLLATRDLDPGEREAIKRHGITIFTMEQIDKLGMSAVLAKAHAKLEGVDYLHVSFDLDSMDPTAAPGVGTPVKGGLNYREAHLVMEMMNEFGKLTSLEFVEVNPVLDDRNKSAELAVELILSALGKRII